MTDLKKLAETDRAATTYITALYQLLPCLNVCDVAQEETAQDIIRSIAATLRFQRRIQHGFSTGFTDACSAMPAPESVEKPGETTSLTSDEQAELKELNPETRYLCCIRRWQR